MGKPHTDYYLASRCPSCGAAKSRPSATAYVYCDYCGNLADYDFRKACEQSRELPGPAYEKLAAALKPQCEQAARANDRATYLENQLKLFDAWVDACPKAVPVRVGDADFRREYVAHMAECATACAFDPVSKQIAEDMTRATGRLQWKQAGTSMRCSHESFLPVLETVLASMDRCYSDELQQQYRAHPDGAVAPLLKRIGHALFVQGWLPYLESRTAELLLERTGLAREYLEAESHAPTQLDCGRCKATVPVFAGARHCVCEHCGSKLAVGQGLRCDGCGSQLAAMANSHDFQCPHCQRKIERIGSTWQNAFAIQAQA